jgi:hypothetical protein
LRYIWGMKHRRTIFHSRVGTNVVSKKVWRDTLHRTCVFASDGICGSGSAFRQVRAGNIYALFFVLRWSRCGFIKKCAGTCYAKLMFLHPVGSAGHIVHSTASGAQNIKALFFMLGCPWCSFQKLCRTCVFVSGGICGSCSALRYIRGTKYRCTIFLALVGPKRI